MMDLLKASCNVEKIGGLDQHIMAIAYVPEPGIMHYVGTGEPVADIEGSCGCVDCSKCPKEGCYAIRDYKRFVNYRNACITNTKALRRLRKEHPNAENVEPGQIFQYCNGYR